MLLQLYMSPSDSSDHPGSILYTIQNLQRSPIPQTGQKLFFAVSYSKLALVFERNFSFGTKCAASEKIASTHLLLFFTDKRFLPPLFVCNHKMLDIVKLYSTFHFLINEY